MRSIPGVIGKMRTLIAYCAYREDILTRYQRWISRLQDAGHDILGLCITIDAPGPHMYFPELDRRWHYRDKKLLSLYDTLGGLCTEADCLINLHGANLHPDLVSQLPTYNVYICNDDPEGSDLLSKPCAPAFDYCFTGNAACVDLYRSWGIENVGFLPLGFFEDDYDPTLTEERILNSARPLGVGFVGERQSPWRRDRLDRIAAAFPEGHFYGRGWPKTFVPNKKILHLYGGLRIGFNIHNSLGPVNRRTYALPANGVMQICDNRNHLGMLFNEAEEVVGVDSVTEMIEKAQYYLENEKERRRIAAAGWKRTLRDYSELAVWKRLMDTISRPVAESIGPKDADTRIEIKHPTFLRRLCFRTNRFKNRLMNRLPLRQKVRS